MDESIDGHTPACAMRSELLQSSLDVRSLTADSVPWAESLDAQDMKEPSRSFAASVLSTTEGTLSPAAERTDVASQKATTR